MKRILDTHQIHWLLILLVLLSLAHCVYSQNLSDKNRLKVSYSRDIAPILAARCQGCHHDNKASMDFNVTSIEKLRRGGKQSGPDEMIVPGKPEESRLIEVIQASAEPRMPLKLKPLSEKEISLVSEWIRQGAIDDGPTPQTALTSLVPPEEVLRNFSASRPEISSSPVVAISADASQIAITESNFIYIYSLNQNGMPTRKLGPIDGQISALLFSNNGESLFIAASRPGLEGVIERWEVKSAQRKLHLKVHDDQILSMKLSSDGKRIATASYDKSIVLINHESGQLAGRLMEHTDAVYDIAFDPMNANRLASVSADRTLKIWDLVTKKRVETLSESTAEQYSLEYSGNGKIIFGAGVDRTIRGWDVTTQPVKLVSSALAHESPVNRLTKISSDNSTEEIISFSEDLTAKRWNTANLLPIGNGLKLEDWASSVASNKNIVAIGTFNGSVSIYKWGKTPSLIWQKKPGNLQAGSPESFKPQLFRNSALGAPSPRVVTAGQENEITLSAAGIENAYRIHISPPEIKMIGSRSNKPNTLSIQLKVPVRSHFDTARLKVATSSGITSEQTLGILPSASTELKPVTQPVLLMKPEDHKVIQATIEKAGQIARFQIKAEKDKPITISSLCKKIGSTLTPLITLRSSSGNVIGQVREINGIDPIISITPKDNSPITVEISDSLFSAGNNHIIYLLANYSPVFHHSFPTVIPASSGRTENITLHSESSEKLELQLIPNKTSSVTVQSLPEINTWQFQRAPKVLTSAIPVVSASSNKVFTPPLSFHQQFQPGVAENRIQIKAKKKNPLIIETYARRLGKEIDTFLEIRDAKGQPVQSAAFRKVTDTLVAFRDHSSRQKGIRLTQWNDFKMGDYVLIGREICRIFQLPRNPDDDCQFFGDQMRWGFFGTTPEQHSMSQTVTRLELLPNGMENTITSNLIHRTYYNNDDGGAEVENDSWIYFDPPADGDYEIIVRENTGFSGLRADYALVIRSPEPDFEIQLSPMDWNIPAGGSKIITANIRRKDGFNEPVELHFTGLPEGWHATEGRIEADQVSCDMLITPDFTKPEKFFDQLKWRLVATSELSGKKLHEEIQADNAWAVITPESNLRMSASTYHLKIKSGSISRMLLNVDRREPFAGRVPIDVRNLPYGVRVLDIGLNGVLITEPQKQREIRIYAEPWVKVQKRPFYAVGRAESAVTSDSSPPIMLEVEP